MKKAKLFLRLILVVCSLLIFNVSESPIDSVAEEEEYETKISHHGSKESHNIGKNCMNCHYRNGPGKVWFTVAGTVYKDDKVTTNPNSTLKLYEGFEGIGSLLMTIEVDGLGNFYTTEPIDFGSGLYPVVIGTTGHTRTKDFPAPDGQCNSCHDSENRIWVD